MIALFKFSENYENKKDLRNIHRIINYKIINYNPYSAIKATMIP